MARPKPNLLDAKEKQLSEAPVKVEIVRPKWTSEEWGERIAGSILNIAILTLVVFWFFASWFPELGLTYWQLVLPVSAFRFLISHPLIGRQLK